MEPEIKAPEASAEPDATQETAVPNDPPSVSNTTERKEDEEEEEEEEEEDKIIERSHNGRFHKRNKRFPKQIEGVDSAFVAIEPKSGKDVIWNECVLSEKKTEKEQNRYLSIIKKLKRNSHPFLARFLDAWISKSDDGPRKLVFITERLDECSLKQFLCNSPKNSRSWKRHVGQILSVLMFLHRLGITHGNLTKETIYYQNSGNLRVGPFALGRCLDQKSQSSDVHSLGVVALEIAVWNPTDFPQTLSQADLIQEMMTRLENVDQKNFIEMCFDPNPPPGDRIKRLINHPAVTEVPGLKLLSAKVIVSTMRSSTAEEGTTTEPTGFAALLKEYLSHYEDEAVIVDVHFPHDNIVNSRSWKDFRSNFTLTPKFLDDVKNGFYPLFGCHWAAYQELEDESIGASAGPTNGLTGISSAASLVGRGELSAVPSSLIHSSFGSAAPSTSVSRKHSSATKPGEVVGSVPVLTEDDGPDDNPDLPTQLAVGRSVSLCDPVAGRPPVLARGGRQSETSLPHPPLFQQVVRPLASKEEVSSLRSTSSVVGLLTTTSGLGSGLELQPNARTDSQVVDQLVRDTAHSPSPVDALHVLTGLADSTPKAGTTTATGTVVVAASSTSAMADIGLETGEKLSVPLDDTTPVGREHPTASAVRSSDAGEETGRVEFLIGSGQDPEPLPPLYPKPSTTTVLASEASFCVPDGALSSDAKPSVEGTTQEAEEEEEDKDEEEDDEEEDEDEEEDKDEHVDPAERYEPQTIHVTAPEHAPTHPALFTHCQYLYVGTGRWQVYVQMWFVEERLKREAYVQVFEHEWHNYERVADLFEASRCLNPIDRPNLLKLLALARHNCALIDGELQFPGSFNSHPTHFDAYELHEKLTVLRLHQQFREREIEATDVPPVASVPDTMPDPSLPTSGVDTELPGSVSTEKDTAAAPTQPEPHELDGRLGPDDVAACADHVAQLQEHRRGSQQPARAPTSLSPPRSTVADSIGIHTRSEVMGPSLFVDVGALAPRNAYCALCDTHDYLHHVELPAYLISGCFHCRESLAREAKISPEVLLDLHMQHNIPWPAFLQARFNIPGDGHSLEELIAYDCRWRSRQPCRCLVPFGGPLLPPCVEFPWLCPPTTTPSCNGVSSHVTSTTDADREDGSPTVTSTVPPVVEPSSNSGVHCMSDVKRLAESKNGSPPQTTTDVITHPADSTVSVPPPALSTHSASTRAAPSLLLMRPCANRHPRGCPTTCCHGIRFPQIGIDPEHMPSVHLVTQPPQPATAAAAAAPATAEVTQSVAPGTTGTTTTGHSSGGGGAAAAASLPSANTVMMTPNGVIP